jgi:hypothetical protein
MVVGFVLRPSRPGVANGAAPWTCPVSLRRGRRQTVSGQREKPPRFVVLSSDIRVGTGGLLGVGIDSLPPEEAAGLRPVVAAMEVERTVASSRFLRVAEIGAKVAASGVTAELLAIEIREEGGRGTLRLDAGSDNQAAGGSFLATITIEDDAGTIYEAAAGPWHRGAMPSRAEFFFQPRPPAAASGLRISVARLDPWQPPGSLVQPARLPNAPIEGPWKFRAAL